MPPLIDDFEQRFLLHVTAMDETHREFVNLVNRMEATNKSEFASLFERLLKHTQAHFDAEQRMMEDSKFPATGEHRDDHLRVLGELSRFSQRVASGSTMLARAYVCEQLPGWFELHAQTMDSALAAHLKQREHLLS
ncbi:MAG: hemerythrin domain-containing protein [Candidatus Thiodiazotropha sp.]